VVALHAATAMGPGSAASAGPAPLAAG
jgi:hypothetical protein